MKKLLLFAGILLSAWLSPAAFSAPNLTGKWSGTLQMEGGNSSKPVYMILKQDGNKLSGSAGPDDSEQHPFAGGKVEGSKVTFDVLLGGGPGLMHFDLQVRGDHITGQTKRSGEGLNEAAKISMKRTAEK